MYLGRSGKTNTEIKQMLYRHCLSVPLQNMYLGRSGKTKTEIKQMLYRHCLSVPLQNMYLGRSGKTKTEIKRNASAADANLLEDIADTIRRNAGTVIGATKKVDSLHVDVSSAEWRAKS
jgi:hypothetical protein